MDYKEYARQLRENAIKDQNGVIRCSPELWEQIASIIENIDKPNTKPTRNQHGFSELKEDEIVKAMEDCTSNTPPCTRCKYDGDSTTCDECMGRMIKDALDLIKRLQGENENKTMDIESLTSERDALQEMVEEQKAEVEKLNIRNKALTAITKNYDWKFEKAKSEAIKEFAEVLKNRCDLYRGVTLDLDDIDGIVKEMVGEE